MQHSTTFKAEDKDYDMRYALLFLLPLLVLIATSNSLAAKELSDAELIMYENLEELQERGEIQGLRIGPVFRFRNIEIGLETDIKFQGDFMFVADGTLTCLEVRKKIGPVFKLKYKLMKAFYPHINFIVLRS